MQERPLRLLFNNFIINICKVRNVIYIVSLIFEISSYRIKHDHWSGITDMNVVIYRRSTNIHSNLSLMYWNEFFLLFGKCIIQLHVIPPLSMKKLRLPGETKPSAVFIHVLFSLFNFPAFVNNKSKKC